MYGVPKTLNTKQDYERVHSLALSGEASQEEVKKHWQGLINSRMKYEFDRVLSESEDPDGPAPDFIVLDVKLDDNTIERRQQKLVSNPNAAIFRLGYNVAEVESKINELGG